MALGRGSQSPSQKLKFFANSADDTYVKLCQDSADSVPAFHMDQISD
ncbi:MAG: hypothetical protein [Olavius algarvensis Gamma 3 endosymbiont]|nr:MAG: hypothetical protein [Olavius algarvensis Gamma 3 endosymbiont]